MKALILSCNTGGGHNSAARAIAEEMQERGDEAYVLDYLCLACLLYTSDAADEL